MTGAGVAQIIEGIRGNYRKYLRIPYDRESILHPICSYGLVARGLVFLVIGGFFLFAAFVVQPEQAASMPEALEWVRQLPFGAILYGVATSWTCTASWSRRWTTVF